MSPFLTVAITTFNRSHVIQGAIDSALQFVSDGLASEILIIDDCSNDFTVEQLKIKYKVYIDDGTMRVIRLNKNVGVTGAKNRCFEFARGQWVMLLDSDDRLIDGCAERLISELVKWKAYPIVFFRCVDRSGILVGSPQDSPIYLTCDDLIMRGTPGECLPVVSRCAVADGVKFDDDLRGFELIGYYRLLRMHGKAVVSTLVARVYDTSDDGDRLSSTIGLKKRRLLLSKGYVRLSKESFGNTPLHYAMLLFLKAVWHFIRAV